MSTNHTGNVQPAIDLEEHDSKNVNVKKVAMFVYDPDTDDYIRQKGNSSGVAISQEASYDVLIADHSSNANISYIGKAAPGTATSAAAWQIKEVDESSGTQFRLADGDASFDNVWDNRESLTY